MLCQTNYGESDNGMEEHLLNSCLVSMQCSAQLKQLQDTV